MIVRSLSFAAAMASSGCLVGNGPTRMRSANTVGHASMYDTWSDPQELTGSARIARFPLAVNAYGKEYVSGSDIPSLLEPTYATSELASLWNNAERWFDGPASAHPVFVPRIGVHRDGSLEMLWGEPDGNDNAVDLPFNVRRLWSASRDRQGNWSQSKPVYESDEIEWNKGIVGNLAAQGDQFAIAVRASSKERELVLVSFRDGHWSVNDIPRARGSTASTALDAETTYVAYLGTAPNSPLDVNSVFLVRSDSGTAWCEPLLINRSGSQPAQNPIIRVSGSHRVHVAWLQASKDGGISLRHRLSDDGGRTFLGVDEVGLGDGIHMADAAIDGRGRLHVVFEHFPGWGDEGSLEEAVWDHGWSQPRLLFPGLRAMDPSLAVDERGNVLMVMVAQSAAIAPNPHVRTYISRLR